MTEETYRKKRKESLKAWFSGISIYQFRTEVLSLCNYSTILTNVKAYFAFHLPSLSLRNAASSSSLLPLTPSGNTVAAKESYMETNIRALYYCSRASHHPQELICLLTSQITQTGQAVLW